MERKAVKARLAVADSYAAVSAYLLRLKTIYKKVRLKEYRLIKQGLRELKAKEAKIDSSLIITEIIYTPVVESSSKVYPSLVDGFALDSSFPCLPMLDLFSFSIP